MEIRPEIAAAYGGHTPFWLKGRALKMSEKLQNQQVLTVIATSGAGLVAVTPSQLVVLRDSNFSVTVDSWNLQCITSVKWSNDGILMGSVTITFRSGRHEWDAKFSIVKREVEGMVQVLDTKLKAGTVQPAVKPFPLGGTPTVRPGQLSEPISKAMSDRNPTAPDPKSPRVFEVHTLGPSGSGKTVFMASLFKRLGIRRPELSFFVKSDHESSVHLNTIYNMLSNPAESWPEASRGINEWRFTTCVQSPSGDFEPLEFRYLDYPGGILTNPRGAGDQSIQALVQRLKSANALLVLLDGQALKALLRDEPLGQRYMSFDLTSSLEIVQQSRCPVHFVITKWDLLAPDYTLEDVRKRLMLDENFRDLITAKTQDAPATIRLFPISAVGFGFANLTNSGDMQKVGAPVRPHNVELPMLSVLPDFMQFAHEEVCQREAQIENQGEPSLSDRLLAPSATQKWQPALGNVAQRAAPKLHQMLVARHPNLALLIPEKVLLDAVGFGERMLAARTDSARIGRQRYAAQLMNQRQSIDSERGALDLLEKQCANIIASFEEQVPASILAGGLDRFPRWSDQTDEAASRDHA